jgi:VWFA-related protein
MMIGESDVGRGLLIVFSDGVDTSSWLTASQVLDAARRSDIVVYGVAVQSRNKQEFFRELTTATGGRLYEIERTASLDRVFVQVLEEFRQRYLVSYTPRGVEATGWHRLSVGIKGRKVSVRARPGYLAGSVSTPAPALPQ